MEVEDEIDAAGVIDLCVGLVGLRRGGVHFLGRDWRGQTYRENLDRRGRIGSVVQRRSGRRICRSPKSC